VRVGEVAERAGVNVETLRYYERRGLLPAPEREPSGHRRYDEETVRFVRAIKDAQAVGFTLAEIAEFLRAARRSAAPSEALRVRMAAKIDEIDARIAQLRRMREELARVVGCACASLDHCTCGAAYLARRGRESAARPSLLHVTNGESAGNTLRQTALGGAVLPWQDVLHEGPVPAVPRPKLLRVRAGFLADCGWGGRRAILSALERRDSRLVEALRDGLQVVFWFEHDLYDQLQLLDSLALAHEIGASPELIVVDSFPGKPSFRGLGELAAGELESLWPSRRPAGPDVLAAAALAWDAFRAPEPTALAEWARPGLPGLPFLGPALGRLLEELPAATDGLSGTERCALQAIAGGADTPGAAFGAAQQLEDAPFLGDAWFYRALAGLGTGRARLVETSAGCPLPAPPPLGDGSAFTRIRLRLTAAGERVLRGDDDRVELLGIDRWLGGTHLTPETVWRWNREAGEPVRVRSLPPRAAPGPPRRTAQRRT
jgi:redox-sensitive transcriptional activator SoxR